MFTQARFKLTIWYALISLIVSALFSAIIFSILHQQLYEDERRMELRLQQFRFFDPNIADNIMQRRAELEQVENHIKLNLVYVNAVIFLISSAAGYFLSGRTLRPIQEAVDKQNQFIADASHELRTPLTALKTGIEVNLRDKKLDLKQAKTVLKENLDDVNKLKILSESLLTLAAFQKPTYNQFENISLKQVILDAIESTHNLAKAKKIKVHVAIDDVSISADKKKLTEMFIIFLDNAIKYSFEKTEIAINSSISRNVVSVDIQDHGIGIDNADLPHIFERFYRVDKSRSRLQTDGFGIGLAIAKEILEHHHGSVAVDSTVGKGTTFTIRLPIEMNLT